MIDAKLKNMLVCPADKAPLREDAKNQCLICTHCGIKYPVRNGIPIMHPPSK
jgi:uncharacterized protein YbaR (Trm112 family)